MGTHSIPAHVSEWLDEDRRHAGVGEGEEAEEEDEGSGDEAHPRLACYWFGSLVQTQFIFCSHPSPAVTTCVTVLSRKYQPDQPCYLYFGEDFPGKLFKLDLYSCVVYHPRHSNPKNCGD